MQPSFAPYARQRAAVQTAVIVRSYGTVAVDTTLTLSTGDIHTLTLGASLTLTLDVGSVPDRTRVRVELTQDATGSRLVTWAGATWLEGSAPTLRTAAGAIDLIEFTYSSAAATWYGVPIGSTTVPSLTVSPGIVQSVGGSRAGKGPTSMATGTFTTIFAAAVDGAYRVDWCLGGSGATYVGTALLTYDGATLLLVSKTVGVNTDVQASGTNVQIKQSSGSTLPMAWAYTFTPFA